MTLATRTADRRAPDLVHWRTALDPPDVPHHEAWATLDLLSALWQPERAASLLTPSGVPLEFTFRSGSDGLIYTAEPGQPGYSPHAKWSVIRAITAASARVGVAPRGHPDRVPSRSSGGDQGVYGGPPLPELVTTLRQQPGQRFGCWLGVRQGSGAAAYKLYQEVTPAAREQTRQGLYVALPTLDPSIAVVPQLVGHELAGGAIEYYLHVPDPRPSNLHSLLKAAGASGQLRLCSEILASLIGAPVTRLRERIRLGLSYRLAPDQTPVVSLFLHAVQISERNVPVRVRLLELATQLELDLSRYAHATDFLYDDDPPTPLHSLIGLTVESTGRLSFSVGVSPPSFDLSCDNGAYVSPSEE